MKDYLLFIDTETSGLPKKWNKPYSEQKNWPYSLQISWLVFTSAGEEVKREDHYIYENDIEISETSRKIHGITLELLHKQGKSRKAVMQLLANDLNTFKPMVIGHFLELDYHMVAADFYRSGIENPIANLPTFCTMRATSHLVRNPIVKYLRLGELYSLLFDARLENQHNALVDAEATARCFFELVKRGDINDEKIELQQEKPSETSPTKGCLFNLFLLLIVFFVLTIYWL